MFLTLKRILLISANSGLWKKLESETWIIFFNYLDYQRMLELEDELFKINLPCKVDQSLVDEFYKDINHGSHQDDDSSTGPIRSYTVSRDSKKSVSNKTGWISSKNLSTGPIRSNTGSKASKSSNRTEIRSQTFEEDHKEESEDALIMFME